MWLTRVALTRPVFILMVISAMVILGLVSFSRLNAELYPNSAPTYAMMAQAYNRKNDKENAIRSLEKAVQLDPNNQQAKRMLDQLKASK